MQKPKNVLDAESKFQELKKKSDKEILSKQEREDLRAYLRTILAFYSRKDNVL
jgi:hypothetical protein